MLHNPPKESASLVTDRRSISAKLWREVDEEKEALFALMEQVQKKLSSQQDADANLMPLNLRQCTWREVMAQVDHTARRWKNRSSKQGRTMVLIDRLGRNSSALESWLGL